MRAIIKALFGRSQTEKNPTEAKPADTATAQKRLSEFQNRLSDIFVKDPLQVVGRAFIIEIVDENGDAVLLNKAHWRAPFEGLVQTAAGISGIYRTVSSSIYFVRLHNVHLPDGSLYCDLLKAQLSQLIEDDGLHVRFSAALPGPSGQIEFVPFETTEKLEKIIDALMRAGGKTVASLNADPPGKFEEPHGEDIAVQNTGKTEGQETTPAERPDNTRDDDPRQNPQWHIDDVWDPVKTLPLWQENDGPDFDEKQTRPTAEWQADDTPERSAPAPTLTPAEPSSHKGATKKPAPTTFTTSADRLKKVEAAISGQINALELAYYPVWNATTRKAVRTCVTPAKRLPDNTWHRGDDLFGRGLSAALSCELDCAVIDKFLTVREEVQPKDARKFIVPIHYAAIKSRHMCFSLLETAKTFGAEKTDLMIVGIDEPDCARTIQMANQILAPVFGEFWLEFTTPEKMPVDVDRGSANWVGFEISGTLDDSKLAELSGKFADSAGAKSLKPFARGMLSKSALMILPAMGVDTFATPSSASSELQKQHLAIPFAANNMTAS